MDKIASIFTLLLENFFEVLGDGIVFVLAAVLMTLFYAVGILQ
jgi:hypothetical protein